MNEIMIQEINDLHKSIVKSMQALLIKGVKIGKLLYDIKESGVNFENFVHEYCVFSLTTAYNYVNLYTYREVIANERSTTDALKKIRQLQLTERMEKEKREREVFQKLREGKIRYKDLHDDALYRKFRRVETSIEVSVKRKKEVSKRTIQTFIGQLNILPVNAQLEIIHDAIKALRTRAAELQQETI